MNRTLRVLVAEAPWGERLRTAFANESTTELIGVADDGFQAVAMTAALRPDVVVIDASLPQLDGVEVTRRIMTGMPTPIVVAADDDAEAIALAMRALRAGALTAVPKPPRMGSAHYAARCAAVVAAARAMASVKLVTQRSENGFNASPPPRAAARPRPQARLAVVAIGASTGGPAALQRLLAELPASFALPILVTQHISPGFTQGFVSWLDEACSMRVKVAEQGDSLRAATVYVAADDRHLTVAADGTIALTRTAPEHNLRPSATVMFQSVADVFGPRAVAVILTGMGRDGIGGLTALHAAGGTVVAQNEASSAVFGMPKAAIDAGIADAVLPLEGIAPHLIARTATRSEGRS